MIEVLKEKLKKIWTITKYTVGVLMLLSVVVKLIGIFAGNDTETDSSQVETTVSEEQNKEIVIPLNTVTQIDYENTPNSFEHTLGGSPDINLFITIVTDQLRQSGRRAIIAKSTIKKDGDIQLVIATQKKKNTTLLLTALSKDDSLYCIEGSYHSENGAVPSRDPSLDLTLLGLGMDEETAKVWMDKMDSTIKASGTSIGDLAWVIRDEYWKLRFDRTYKESDSGTKIVSWQMMNINESGCGMSNSEKVGEKMIPL